MHMKFSGRQNYTTNLSETNSHQNNWAAEYDFFAALHCHQTSLHCTESDPFNKKLQPDWFQ